MTLISTERVIADAKTDATKGQVRWAPMKSLWLSSMVLISLTVGAAIISWSAVAVFVVLSSITICAGHSVGMHRLLIRRSFKTPIWVEHILVYLGVLVSMAGPHGMIKLHDMRDWGQRQKECHDFFTHKAGFWKDAWWQLHCRLELEHAPRFRIEENVSEDRFYKFVERTWMLQQIPLGIILFLLGGLPWVVWGICCRISASLIGHWLVGYFAHQEQDQVFNIKNTSVQGYNLDSLGIATFGEAYHGNHHAFPESAKLGFLKGQIDIGWWLVSALEKFGLAREINTPDNLGLRDGLELVSNHETVEQSLRVKLCHSQIQLLL